MEKIKSLKELLVKVVTEGSDELLWEIVNKIDLASVDSTPAINAAILSGDRVKVELLLKFGASRPVLIEKNLPEWKYVDSKIINLLETYCMLPKGYYKLAESWGLE